MRFVLVIQCDNAAFDGEKLVPEIARILKQTVDDIDTNTSKILRDINGNGVGRFEFIYKNVEN